MSKNRKHRKSPVGGSSPAPSPGNGSKISAGLFPRQVLIQSSAIVGLSCILGFTFNSASPLGIRFGESAPAKVAEGRANGATTPMPASPTQAVKVPLPSPPRPPLPAWYASWTQQTEPPLPSAPVVVPPPPSAANALPATNPAAFKVSPLSRPPNPASIHWPEAKSLVAAGHAVLVDVRHRSMYDAGHIPGAISLPETSPPPETMAFLNQQPTNMTVIVYCSSTSCSQSARVANRLVQEFRWPSVRYMTGGYLEYQQAELAKSTPASAP